ncbi:hypothetical protein Rsub_01407 [Raphidocelis subcapitata]|uniref:C2HC zinc finger plants domain-containing protein n=1 Tax=Raphidocelis subcapitata TaxID=307507 RepID=A0A2V0NMY5_9CHLO|nr:hypothetical protein Rsub_01407 [Raphidocelis subcapitata]|eukprot:GBF88908.1 hypothetical protein Rsub_01407 [Raphidocelis subcapitata]
MEVLPRSIRVRALLDEARHRLAARQAGPALELVIRALQLCEGEEALRPALAAALRARQGAGPAPGPGAAAAPAAADAPADIHELAQLFSQITVQAEQVLQAAEPQGPSAPTSAQAHAAAGPAAWQQQPHWHLPQPPVQHHHDHNQQQHQQWQQQQAAPYSQRQQQPMGAPPWAGSQAMEVEGGSVDGDSFVCNACGGLVAASRREQHEAWWCPAAAAGQQPPG